MKEYKTISEYIRLIDLKPDGIPFVAQLEFESVSGLKYSNNDWSFNLKVKNNDDNLNGENNPNNNKDSYHILSIHYLKVFTNTVISSSRQPNEVSTVPSLQMRALRLREVKY